MIWKKGCSSEHPLYLPQEYAKDCYPKVRLEAGALHLANYLIRVRGLFLVAKVTLIIESARALYKKTKPDSLNIFKGYRESTLQIYDSLFIKQIIAIRLF